MSTFDSTKMQLLTIVREIAEGKIQLPDFQRGWVWDDNHIRSLLVSIARAFPIGAVMLLETGGDVRFQVRPVENVVFESSPPSPEKLILDGQQRLTSLTQVLSLPEAVQTFDEKKRRIQVYYYIDIELALEDGRLEDAFFAVDKERVVKTNFGRDVALDLSTREKECSQLMFPCSEILDSDSWEDDLLRCAPEQFALYMKFRQKVLKPFRTYQVPIIALGKATSKEAVCLVFEKVNTGGVPLTVFELITASFAAEGFNLRDDWFGSELRDIEGRKHRLHDKELLKTISNTDFLQTITLLNTYEKRKQDLESGKVGKLATAVSAKRASMLNLEVVDYQKWAEEVEAGFLLVERFLRKECFYSKRDLPYRTQLLPLAAMLTLLKEKWLEPRIYQKLSQWFWCGVLGELYGGAVETRMANDLEEMFQWFQDDALIPRTVYEATFQASRLKTLTTRNSAAYKALNTLLLKSGAKDFFWQAGIEELHADGTNLDIHHIFPKAWCKTAGIRGSLYNSILNKTPISYKANRMIGGKAPSLYLKKLQKHEQVKSNAQDMDEILKTHYITPEFLREDNFFEFLKARAESLFSLVYEAMGKEKPVQELLQLQEELEQFSL